MAVKPKRERIKNRSIMLPTTGRCNGGQEVSKGGPGKDIGRKARTCTVSWKPGQLQSQRQLAHGREEKDRSQAALERLGPLGISGKHELLPGCHTQC